jgi:hypothetical protein
MDKMTSLLVQLQKIDREKIERLSASWGLSLGGTIRRIIKEYKEDV